MENKSIYLGLTGRMGSGKGEIISMLTQEFDFCDISLSDIVREEAAKTNREINRLTMQDIGNRLRKKEGAGVLGKRIYQKISRSNKEKWIIDGIRNPAEITELKKLQKFYLIGITTDLDILIGRIQNRRRQTDMADREEINNRLEREWGKNEPAEGQQVGKFKRKGYLLFKRT